MLRTTAEISVLAARGLAAAVDDEERVGFARAVVSRALAVYWREHRRRMCKVSPLRKLPSGIKVSEIPEEAEHLARTIGMGAAGLDVMDSSHMIGVLYTGMMPGPFRAQLGAYYTPPALCERLLDMASEAGVDWASVRVLDPACGGGAFLSPVARRMAKALKGCTPKSAVASIQERLKGFELDPFAAWMSQVFLDVTLMDLCQAAGTRLRSTVRVCNSLEQMPKENGFDLVVGNPPYGRVTLPPGLRAKYARSLFGHANLYGLFTDLALRFARPGGVIAYVTPTSFLAGEYFKALRGLLGREAPPVIIDFIEKREGVFADVLQETLLAAYRRGANTRTGKVHFISPRVNGSVDVSPAGCFTLPGQADQPWMMPRTESQSVLASYVGRMPYRLSDYGYTVSTGPLVWNRHKSRLRDRPGKGRYPLIWAEAVRADGVFEFRAKKKNHKPYFEPAAEDKWVITNFPCVLLQRTTAKEQCRRLIAAELPAVFIAQNGAVVVENHLNMIKPIDDLPAVKPATLTALLNSEIVDQIFRCMNGSVAVSAYELEALPLPSPKGMKEIERLVNRGAKRQTLERALERMYASREQ